MAQTTRTPTSDVATSLPGPDGVVRRMRAGNLAVGITYDQGYADGYAAGYAAGYTAGHSAGYTSGFADGDAAGLAAGYASGYADGFAAGVASVIPDPSAPTLTIVSPTPGVDPGQPGGFPIDARLAAGTEIVLRLTDTTSGGTPAGIALATVRATFAALAEPEPVYDRGQFVGLYIKNSYQVAITNGVELHVRREDGWPASKGVLGDIQFDVNIVDKAGNLT